MAETRTKVAFSCQEPDDTLIALIGHSQDDVDVAKRLENALVGIGLTIHPSQKRFDAEGELEGFGQAISSSDLLFLLWSASSQSSQLVSCAWTTALSMKKTIIPCLLDPTPLPDSLQTTPGIPFNDFEQGLAQIFSKLNLRQQESGNHANHDSLAEIGTIITARARSPQPSTAAPTGAR